jgi:hypothetical protein
MLQKNLVIEEYIKHVKEHLDILNKTETSSYKREILDYEDLLSMLQKGECYKALHQDELAIMGAQPTRYSTPFGKFEYDEKFQIFFIVRV